MDNDIIERLAELEHIQWVEWSKSIAEKETLSAERIIRWSKLWVPYSELPENEKDVDRIYAYRVLRVLGEIDE